MSSGGRVGSAADYRVRPAREKPKPSFALTSPSDPVPAFWRGLTIASPTPRLEDALRDVRDVAAECPGAEAPAVVAEAWERLVTRWSRADLAEGAGSGRVFLRAPGLPELSLTSSRGPRPSDAPEAAPVPSSLGMVACALAAMPGAWLAAEELALEAASRLSIWWRNPPPTRVAWTLRLPGGSFPTYWKSAFHAPGAAAMYAREELEDAGHDVARHKDLLGVLNGMIAREPDAPPPDLTDDFGARDVIVMQAMWAQAASMGASIPRPPHGLSYPPPGRRFGPPKGLLRDLPDALLPMVECLRLGFHVMDVRGDFVVVGVPFAYEQDSLHRLGIDPDLFRPAGHRA